MPSSGMPVFTLIATGRRHQNMRTGQYCFAKKALHTGFRLVPNSMTLNDLERRNSFYFAFFHGI